MLFITFLLSLVIYLSVGWGKRDLRSKKRRLRQSAASSQCEPPDRRAESPSPHPGVGIVAHWRVSNRVARRAVEGRRVGWTHRRRVSGQGHKGDLPMAVTRASLTPVTVTAWARPHFTHHPDSLRMLGLWAYSSNNPRIVNNPFCDRIKSQAISITTCTGYSQGESVLRWTPWMLIKFCKDLPILYFSAKIHKFLGYNRLKF